MNLNLDEKQDLISVIIPVYNVENYLGTCIESVLQQTYKQLEILLIDDGSTDRSIEICNSYSEIDARVRVIRREKKGVSSTRNYGLKQAQGKYICFVDSDDILHHQFLEAALREMRKYGVQLVKGECQYFSEEEELPFSRSDLTAVPVHMWSGREELLRSFDAGRKIKIAVWAALYERSLLEDLWFEAGRLHEDFMYTCEVLCRTEQFLRMDAAVYGYRQRSDSICNAQIFGKRQYDYLQVRVQRIRFLEEHKPDLIEPAIAELISECMIMQCMIWNQKPDKGVQKVQALVRGIMKRYPPTLSLLFNSEISWRRKAGILGARLSFNGACRFKRFLMAQNSLPLL